MVGGLYPTILFEPFGPMERINSRIRYRVQPVRLKMHLFETCGGVRGGVRIEEQSCRVITILPTTANNGCGCQREL